MFSEVSQRSGNSWEMTSKKRQVFCRRRNVDNDSADVTLADESFQIRGPTTGKAWLVTVDSLMGSTIRQQIKTLISSECYF